MAPRLAPVRSRPIAVLLTAALAFGLVGCGDDEPSDAGTSGSTTEVGSPAQDVGPDLEGVEFDDLTAEAEVDVQARDNSFVSAYITVKVGTTVTWTNRGRTEHNVLPAVDGAFAPIEVDQLEPGMSASITFDEAGDFPYYCSLHGTRSKGMVGVVRVVD